MLRALASRRALSGSATVLSKADTSADCPLDLGAVVRLGLVWLVDDGAAHVVAAIENAKFKSEQLR